MTDLIHFFALGPTSETLRASLSMVGGCCGVERVIPRSKRDYPLATNPFGHPLDT